MSEFQSDITDKKYDEDGDELDKHGFKIRQYPNDLETVRKSLENCEQLCGLDKNTVARLLRGEFNQYTTLDHSGRSSRKIVIEYDIKAKKDDT